jgi:predicted acyltransferase
MKHLERIASLDCFRGIVIALMMFVNCAGGDSHFPHWIGHRGWNDGRQGIGLADVVFPLFIFIMGAGAWLTVRSAKSKGLSDLTIIKQAVLRFVALYLCGTILKCAALGFDQPLSWRILLQWDILQMLAWTGLVTKIFLLTPTWLRCSMIMIAIAWKWYLLGFMTFGEHTTHMWTPQANAQRDIISRFGWFAVAFTQGAGASALCMIGAECARQVFDPQHGEKSRRLLLAAGIAACATAIAWSMAPSPIGMPLSKDFFTSSFIVLNAGIGALLLITLWHVIDHYKLFCFTPLVALGKHALAVYMTAELVWRIALMRWKVSGPDFSEMTMLTGIKAHLGSWMNPMIASWIVVTFYVIAWFIFAHIRENRLRAANNRA